MNRLHKHWLILFVVVLLALPMVACGRQDEPARVAEKFLRAAIANDLADLQETVDPDYQDQVMTSIFLQMGLSAFVGGAQVEYTELKVTTIANDGQRATVHATGKLKVITMGTQMIIPEDVQVPLVKKQGRWYVTISETGTAPAIPTKATGRTLTSGDLDGLVLQPDEVPLPFTNYGDTVDTALGHWSRDYLNQFNLYNPQAGYRKSYDQEKIYVTSIALLYRSPADASQAFQELTRLVKETSGSGAKSVPADGLGEQSIGFSEVSQRGSFGEWGEYSYVWRVNNVIMVLIIQDASGQLKIKESDARAFADKMQSHVR